MRKLVTWLPLLVVWLGAAQDFCGSDQLHREKLNSDPLYAKRTQDFDARTFGKKNTARQAATNYVIPVVVHVMHKGEAVGTGTNVSDALIQSQIKQLNQYYRKIDGTPGDGNGVDIGIEFALAVRDPQGNCTNGIDRVDMTQNYVYMANGVKNAANGVGVTDAALKAVSFWDSSKYYNIWVISEFDNGASTIAGYAYFASSHGESYDGTVMLYSHVGSPSSVTLPHELGHALNLYHTFEGDGGGTNCPAVNDCGSGRGDCCSDTPAHTRFTNCNTITTNSCYPNNTDLSYARNYMTYSSVFNCQNMFTQNQKDRMLEAIVEIRGSLLAQNGNMSLVPVVAETPSFTISPSLSCAVGQTLSFTSTTPCLPQNYLSESNWSGISYNWTLTNGTTSYRFSGQNPQFSVSQAGTYTVTLQIISPAGTATNTVPNALIITNGGPTASCTPRNGQLGNFGYTINNVEFAGINNTTSNSVNAGYTDFSCSSNTVLNAGATYPLLLGVRSGNSYVENYRVYIDYNNNGIMEATELVASGANPAASTNTYQHDISIPATAVQNQLLRMRVIGEANGLTDSEASCQSNYFINDVEDYGVYIRNALNTDIIQSKTITVMPNPVEDSFTISAEETIDTVKIYNMLGQLVLVQNINTSEGNINISQLSSGTYLITAQSGTKNHQQKIIKR